MCECGLTGKNPPPPPPPHLCTSTKSAFRPVSNAVPVRPRPGPMDGTWWDIIGRPEEEIGYTVVCKGCNVFFHTKVNTDTLCHRCQVDAASAHAVKAAYQERMDKRQAQRAQWAKEAS